jgi:uncharacterized protein
MRLQTLAAFAALAVALSLSGACREAGAGAGPEKAGAPAQKDPTAEDYVAPPLPRGTVILKDAYGGTHAVEVEIVSTDDLIRRGMMWRKHLAAGNGMLFVFRNDAEHSFWMKNTLIPLDMLFIDHGGQIVELVQNAEPKSLGPRGGLKPCRYVLEVPGGWTQKVGVVTGGRVELRLPAGFEPGR